MAVFSRKKEHVGTPLETKAVLNQAEIEIEKLQVADETSARIKARIFPREDLAISEQLIFNHNAVASTHLYTHRLYFGGEGAFASKQYLVRLINSLEHSKEADPEKAIATSLMDPALNGVFVTRRFMERSSEASHSLASSDLIVGTKRDAGATVRNTVDAAYRSGAPLDFSYKAEDQPIGIRRANVVKREADYFIGEHHRGRRRYRYDRVIEALADGSSTRFVPNEPAATVTFDSNGVGLIRLSFGNDSLISAGVIDMLKNLKLQREELDQRIKDIEQKIKRAKRRA